MALGILGVLHCDQTQNVFFGSVCVRNDWGAVGALGIIVGIILLIVGLVLPSATAPDPPRPQPTYAYAPVAMMPAYPMPYGPGYPAYPQPMPVQAQVPPQAPPQAAPQSQAQRVCSRCGTPVSAQFCPSCGTQQW